MNKSSFAVYSVLLAAGLLGGLGLGGCGNSGSSALLREQGLFAYNGAHVESRGSAVERWLEGSERNRIDILKAKKPDGTFERVKVYIEKAEVEDLSRNTEVVFERKDLIPLLTRATEESITNFGRFDRVSSRDKADLIVQTRLYGVSAWADSSAKANELQAMSGRNDGSANFREKVQREGVDAQVSISFARPDGTVISSERAMGRLVATSGSVIDDATYSYRGTGTGKGSNNLEVTNAKIKPTELPRILGVAVDGAVASTLAGSNLRLWSAQADANGVFTVLPTFKNADAVPPKE